MLLVEDDPDAANLARVWLERSHRAAFSVTNAVTLGQALRCLEVAPYDVIVLDIGLPDSEGLATVGVASLLTAHVPVLVLSSAQGDSLVSRAKESGICGYLVKGEHEAWALPRLVMRAFERADPSVLHGRPPGKR